MSASSTPANPTPPSSEDSPLKRLAGQTILLTGGTGFIGRHLIRRLGEMDARIHLVSRRSADQIPRFEQLSESGSNELQLHRLDLADRDAVLGLYEDLGAKYVFHLASHVAGSRDLDLIAPTLTDNLCSTVHLLEAAARFGCDGFVQVGSLEEPPWNPADGESNIPSSPYAASKSAASAYCRMFHQLYELPVSVARVFMVYGPGHQDEKKLVPYVIRSLMDGHAPSFSSGTRPVDWIFVQDVVEGFLHMAVRPELAGRQVDLGTGELHTVRQVVEMLFEKMDAPEPPAFGGRGDRAQEQVRRADVQATEGLLDWRPAISLEEGLTHTIQGLRADS